MAAIPTVKPDLVFLDIEMPECDGCNLLERIAPSPAFAIIFVTAHHQFALRAFEVAAPDYLLKPFDDQRFERVLERVKKRLRAPGKNRRFIMLAHTKEPSTWLQEIGKRRPLNLVAVALAAYEPAALCHGRRKHLLQGRPETR